MFADNDNVLQKLKEILLEEERENQQKLRSDMVSLQKNVDLMKPFLERKVEELKNDFEKVAQPAISKVVKTELFIAKDMLIESLYPIIGKIIKKYIQIEFEKLSDNIDKQLNQTFTWNNFKMQLRALWEGVSQKDLILKNIDPPIVEEVYIIYQESGLLAAQYSRANTIDQDLIAGMLTAIKSFIEDAFQRKTGTLDMIEYGTFKIILQNSHRHYFAAIVSGTVNQVYKAELLDYMLIFASNHIQNSIEDSLSPEVSGQLKRYFEEFNARYK